MRPSSFNRTPSDYDVERSKRIRGWKNELSEILAKINGSSLKTTDKKSALLILKLEIRRNLGRYD